MSSYPKEPYRPEGWKPKKGDQILLWWPEGTEVGIDRTGHRTVFADIFKKGVGTVHEVLYASRSDKQPATLCSNGVPLWMNIYPVPELSDATSWELLHGAQEEDVTPESDPETQEAEEVLVAPDGWDTCARGYCLGDWLVTQTHYDAWGIQHSVLEVLNSFGSPQLAVDFITKHFGLGEA